MIQRNDQPKEAVMLTATAGFQTNVSLCLPSLKGMKVFIKLVFEVDCDIS